MTGLYDNPALVTDRAVLILSYWGCMKLSVCQQFSIYETSEFAECWISEKPSNQCLTEWKCLVAKTREKLVGMCIDRAISQNPGRGFAHRETTV